MSATVFDLQAERRARLRKVAGIYVTDDVVYWMVADVDDVLVPFTRYRPIVLLNQSSGSLQTNRKNSEEIIRQAAELLASRFVDLEAIGIGCYGPFESLNLADRLSFSNLGRRAAEKTPYGRIQASSSHVHLRGADIFEIIASEFSKRHREPDIRIQTDVAISAFADCVFEQHKRYAESDLTIEEFTEDESHRTWIDNYVAVCLKISVGVGGAVITSREFWPPNRFSEMGHIPMARYEKETLRKSVCGFHRSCLEGYVCEEAIRRRLELSETTELKQALNDADNLERIRPVLADYIAQFCVAATVIAMPNHILLTGKLSRLNGLAEMVEERFDDLMRQAGRGLYPSYKRLTDKDYIRQPLKEKPGVYGSAMFAASYLNKRATS